MFYALCIFAVGLATRHPFAHWLGMIIGLIGFGLNLYAQIRKASDEPYPPEIPNQRAVTRALFRTLAIAFLVPLIFAIVAAVFLGRQ
jgi:hypothetical protein